MASCTSELEAVASPATSAIELSASGSRPDNQADAFTHVPRSFAEDGPDEIEVDPAEDVEQPLRGWPVVARLLAEVPDFQAFQAFTDLNVKSLLYYQAELEVLRRQLHKIEYEDHRSLDASGLRKSAYAKDLRLLLLSKKIKNPEDRKQWDLIKDLRSLLKEYSKPRCR